MEGYTNPGVSLKTELGGTKICLDALVNNEIDFYSKYTGTGLLVILQMEKKKVAELMGNTDNVYQYVKKWFAETSKLALLKPIGFNNAYALMMRRRQAEALLIRTISDLKRYTDSE